MIRVKRVKRDGPIKGWYKQLDEQHPDGDDQPLKQSIQPSAHSTHVGLRRPFYKVQCLGRSKAFMTSVKVPNHMIAHSHLSSVLLHIAISMKAASTCPIKTGTSRTGISRTGIRI
jgi:hypothetical protein